MALKILNLCECIMSMIQESLADARVMRDCSSCMEAPRNLSSAGKPTLEPNITSIGKSVAKLWPLWYIQDGRKPSWIYSYTIRSADPENPTLRPNIMSLCCIQPELC